MGNRIDISELDADWIEVVDTKPIGRELIKSNTGMNPIDSGMNMVQPVGNMAATNIGGLAGLVGIISEVASVIGNIVTSCNLVRAEKEKTKQMAIQAEAFIIAAKEETKRIAIAQQEETKRFEAQLKSEYKKCQVQLKELAIQLKAEQRKLNEDSRRFNEKLNLIKESVYSIQQRLVAQNEYVLNQFRNGRYVDSELLKNIERMDQVMLTLLQEVVKL